MMMEGDHNTDRPQYFLDEVRKFFMFVLYSNDSASNFLSGRGSGADVADAAESSTAIDDAAPGTPSPRLLRGQHAEPDMAYVPIPEPELDTDGQPSPTGQPSPAQSPQGRQPPPKPAKERKKKPVADPSEHRAPQGKDAIREQLMALGFSAEQVDKAMVRNSTLEGCVEWILTNGV